MLNEYSHTASRHFKRDLQDDTGAFELTVIEAAEPSRLVLFAVGGGGDPERHLPLLTSLADHGCTVVAPHFARLKTLTRSTDDLLLRARRLSLALDSVMRPGVPVAGVGAPSALQCSSRSSEAKDGCLRESV